MSYLPAWSGVDSGPFFMPRYCLEDGQHSHFKESALFVEIHQVELDPFAVTSFDTEVEPRPRKGTEMKQSPQEAHTVKMLTLEPYRSVPCTCLHSVPHSN